MSCQVANSESKALLVESCSHKQCYGKYTGCGKKVTPVVFSKFLSNRLEFFDETLQLYSLFILT